MRRPYLRRSDRNMELFWLLGLLKIPAAFCIIAHCYIYYWCGYYLSYLEPNPLNEYDFIVVGGGSAGAVVASRLSENASYSVLLIEAGGYPSTLARIPLISGMLGSSPFNWDYRTEPQEKGSGSTIEKRSYWPRGKGLGGSSILNYMLYVRGNKLDYDQWAAEGNYGWSYEEVLPYFKKSENNRGRSLDEGYHGYDGYLTVEDRAWLSNLPHAFINAGRELGFDLVDINGVNQTGFTIPQVTTRNGERCSSYNAFIEPVISRENLNIVTYAHVHKVLIDEDHRAYGIMYQQHGKLLTVKAKKEIILSAGAVGSPQILMLSGIGPKDHLESLGIPVHVDSRVGENLHDHVIVPLAPLIHNDSEATLVHPTDAMAWWDYWFYGKGQYTSNGIDGMAFKASQYSERSDWPDIQLHFMSYSVASDHGICVRKVLGLTEEAWEDFYRPASYVDTASMFATMVRPKSRGTVRLKSSNPNDHPLIDPQYYSNPLDLLVMLEGVKFARQVVKTAAMKQYNVSLYDVPHPSCKQYNLESDLYLECLVMETSLTLYHPVGTCKMGPTTDSNAVVDPELRVYGVKGLRVADASVIPTIINGNTNAPTVMIAEKAADMILRQYEQGFTDQCPIIQENSRLCSPFNIGSLRNEL